MPPNLLKYSNGWGHLLMSISTQIVAVILLLQNNPALIGVAVGLLLGVSGYWFLSSTANAQQQTIAAQQAAMIQVNPAAPAVTITPAAPAPTTTITGGSNGNPNI